MGQLYKWKRCFFGSKNESFFVSFIIRTKVFRDRDLSEYSSFIGDISEFNDNYSDHLRNPDDIFEQLRIFGLKQIII